MRRQAMPPDLRDGGQNAGEAHSGQARAQAHPRCGGVLVGIARMREAAGALDVAFHVLQGILELNDALAKAAADVGQALAEEQQAEDGDDQPLSAAGHPGQRQEGWKGSECRGHGQDYTMGAGMAHLSVHQRSPGCHTNADRGRILS
jgi:hypothetical protein